MSNIKQKIFSLNHKIFPHTFYILVIFDKRFQRNCAENQPKTFKFVKNFKFSVDEKIDFSPSKLFLLKTRIP